jgi:hypothetical protein
MCALNRHHTSGCGWTFGGSKCRYRQTSGAGCVQLSSIIALATPQAPQRNGRRAPSGVAALATPERKLSAKRQAGSLAKRAAETLVGQLTYAHVTMPHHRTFINPLLAFVQKLQTRASSIQLQPATFSGRVTREIAECASEWLSALATAPARPFATRSSILTSRDLWFGREGERARWVGADDDAVNGR